MLLTEWNQLPKNLADSESGSASKAPASKPYVYVVDPHCYIPDFGIAQNIAATIES